MGLLFYFVLACIESIRCGIGCSWIIVSCSEETTSAATTIWITSTRTIWSSRVWFVEKLACSAIILWLCPGLSSRMIKVRSLMIKLSWWSSLVPSSCITSHSSSRNSSLLSLWSKGLGIRSNLMAHLSIMHHLLLLIWSNLSLSLLINFCFDRFNSFSIKIIRFSVFHNDSMKCRFGILLSYHLLKQFFVKCFLGRSLSLWT